MADLLFFHDDDTPPPQRFWRRWARAEIAAVRARRVADADAAPDANRRPQANREPLRYNPVLLTDEERAAGISLNARWHRLLRGNNG